MKTKLNIGLFGFGTVGQGLYYVLNNSTGFKANISKIAVKHREKKRTVGPELITFDRWEILNDPAIDIVVELIDDAEAAFEIVSSAMKNGKHVVTANKKMIALHLQELYDLQVKHNVSLLYEGSACGSITIIRTLEEYFDNEELLKISGIFNGTTNYILTKTISEKLTYETALKQAQDRGFAESDPTNDVEGYDAKYKTVILAFHTFGLILHPDNVINIGITGLHENDVNYASEKDYQIKLTPVIQRLSDNRISAFVLPGFVEKENHLFNVNNELNGVVVKCKYSGEQFMQGRGAGSYPTGAAVLSDVSALSYGYRYEYKKHRQQHPVGFTNDVFIKAYMRYNKQDDLEKIKFTIIFESYTSGNYNYIVGKINLQQIIENKEYISKNKLFVSLVENEVSLR